MADLLIPYLTVNQWDQAQLALYLLRPEMFPVGANVMEDRTTSAATLVSDGTASNFISLDDAAVTSLIAASKPAGYNNGTKTLPADSPLMIYLLLATLRTLVISGKDERNRRRAINGPLSPTF